MLTRTGRFSTDTGRTVSDTAAYTTFRKVLATADLVYGHNIRRFDLGMFQAGLLRRELGTLPELRTTDTLRDYPKRHDMSASLENLAKIHLDGQGSKMHMAIVDWERANRLEPAGVDDARERVRSDVVLQEALRDRLTELGLLRDPKRWMP